jgi:hypothetical protein
LITHSTEKLHTLLAHRKVHIFSTSITSNWNIKVPNDDMAEEEATLGESRPQSTSPAAIAKDEAKVSVDADSFAKLVAEMKIMNTNLNRLFSTSESLMGYFKPLVTQKYPDRRHLETQLTDQPAPWHRSQISSDRKDWPDLKEVKNFAENTVKLYPNEAGLTKFCQLFCSYLEPSSPVSGKDDAEESNSPERPNSHESGLFKDGESVVEFSSKRLIDKCSSLDLSGMEAEGPSSSVPAKGGVVISAIPILETKTTKSEKAKFESIKHLLKRLRRTKSSREANSSGVISCTWRHDKPTDQNQGPDSQMIEKLLKSCWGTVSGDTIAVNLLEDTMDREIKGGRIVVTSTSHDGSYQLHPLYCNDGDRFLRSLQQIEKPVASENQSLDLSDLHCQGKVW